MALILNTQTGLVTPQYHVIFDENFHTVPSTPVCTEIPHWATLAGLDNVSTVPGRLSPVSFSPITAYEGGPNIDLFPPGHAPSISMDQPSGQMRELTLPAVVSTMGNYQYQTLIAYAASSDPDILYVDQALQAPDRDDFIKAMVKEIKGHEEKGHWWLIPQASVPTGVQVLPSVWALRHKRRLDTGDIYKHKARINVHGGKQVAGEDFDETFAPVFPWRKYTVAT